MLTTEELLSNGFSPFGSVTYNSTLNEIKFVVSYSSSTSEKPEKQLQLSHLNHSHIKTLQQKIYNNFCVKIVMSCSSGLLPKPMSLQNHWNFSKTTKLLVQAEWLNVRIWKQVNTEH